MPRQRNTSSPQIATSAISPSSIDPLLTTPPTAQTAQSASGVGKDETRKIIARNYVTAFLGIVAGTLVFMFLRCYTVANIKDVLLAEAGILSGPLGFIIGFYFKEELEKKGNL